MIIITFIKQLSLIEIIIDALMIMGAIVIFNKLKKVNKELKSISKDSEKAYNSTSSEIRLDAKGDLSRQSETRISRDKFEPIRRRFNEQLVEFIRWSNLISVLPMAGLLGTVWGLISGLAVSGAEESFTHLYASLSMALSSTLVGLVASLILKIYVYSSPERSVNEIEIHFEEIDRLFNNAIDLNNLIKD
ncbi:MotA/TolQ/ExbB proton channel family protein [Butyrivibrio sp. MC2013]|uniref:MotA/TolQ/ExbB proton channel family protein n=1 Tax=Butyrivibrio sp. MC2013 TaxID=1280686 RepID=UPI000424CF62|nr:MotA/TolQ/ExbB proton channel family protein [Butyrivibrio sp. MC2013]